MKKFKLRRIFQYLKCRHRLIRYTVAIDLAEKERILSTYFNMAFRKFPELYNTSSEMPFIRFSVKVSYYKRAPKFQEFEETTKAFCKRLGYDFSAGWCGMGCDDPLGEYFYHVHPTGNLYLIKEAIQYPIYYWDKLEAYYEELRKSK